MRKLFLLPIIFLALVVSESAHAQIIGGDGEDCIKVSWYKDGDGDGWFINTTACSIPGPGWTRTSGPTSDCNDNNAAIHPGATELCDGVDNDCDNQIDEGFTQITYYFDGDGDGYFITRLQCFSPGAGWTTIPGPIGDCNDTNPAINPGATEVCDGVDNDCKGGPNGILIDDGFTKITHYFDGDGDGYFITRLQCFSPGAGWTTIPGPIGDCNDTNPAINPGATEVCDGVDNDCDGQIDEGVKIMYYSDIDGDGYGGRTRYNNSIEACSVPEEGYVTNNADCNDFDPSIHPGATEICGNGIDENCNGTIDDACTPVDSDNDDIADAADNCPATANADQADTDSDGQGNACDTDDDNDGILDVNDGCSSGALTGVDTDGDGCKNGEDGDDDGDGVVDENDCAPLDITLHTRYPFYLDSDGDGFGSGAVENVCAVNAASPPSGYSLNNTDCDATSATAWRNATVFTDIDGDGYTTGDSYSICYGATLPSRVSTTSNGTDCNDNNADVWQSATLYVDGDGDTYTVGTGSTICYGASIPAGYNASKSMTDDCNDMNATVWQSATLYADADSDTYTTGNGEVKCYGAELPTGWIATKSVIVDCAPSDDTKWQSATLYIDQDMDTYTNGTAIVCYGSSIPTGYRASANSTDCDDTNVSIWQSATFYTDTDGDGYTVGNGEVKCYGASLPANFKATKSATDDCDDANENVYQSGLLYIDKDNDGYDSGTATLCYGTVPTGYKATTSGSDCKDDDATLTTKKQFYVDNDKDGFGSNTTSLLCSISAPVGYATVSGDCNDNNAAINPQTNWVLDVDVDGYYATLVTSCASPGNTYVIQSTQLPGDCNDNNASVNPGAVEVCGNKTDDNCNGRIDEAICYPCMNATKLTTTNIGLNSAQLNWTATANPVQWQLQYKTTKQGSKWVDVFVTGNRRSVIINNLLGMQNYQWQIRAKCGNSWTSYSVAIGFTTSASTSVLSKAVPKVEQIVNEVNTALTLSPNPSMGIVSLDLRINQVKAVTAIISIRDFRGIRMHTERTSVVNGLLHRKINLPGKFAAGTYLVEIIVDNAVYTSRLVLIR